MCMGVDIYRLIIITIMHIVTILNITVKSGVWERLYLLIVSSTSKTSLRIRRRLICQVNHPLTNFCKDLVACTTAFDENYCLE